MFIYLFIIFIYLFVYFIYLFIYLFNLYIYRLIDWLIDLMSLFFIYLFMCLFIYIFICLFINLLVPKILRQDNHISRSSLLLLLLAFLLANNQFLESDCKLELDIMYTHAFFVLRTVTLPVHNDSLLACSSGHVAAV